MRHGADKHNINRNKYSDMKKRTHNQMFHQGRTMMTGSSLRYNKPNTDGWLGYFYNGNTNYKQY